jgi:hypothetical protein
MRCSTDVYAFRPVAETDQPRPAGLRCIQDWRRASRIDKGNVFPRRRHNFTLTS